MIPLLLVALFAFIAACWWCCCFRPDHRSSYQNLESGAEVEEVNICVNVVSSSAERKHLHPDCEDRFQAEEISNIERRHEEDTFINTILKLKNIAENFEELEDQESRIKYLRSKDFVEYWNCRRDDSSQALTFYESGMMRACFKMQWDKYCHLDTAMSEKRDVRRHGSEE